MIRQVVCVLWHPLLVELHRIAPNCTTLSREVVVGIQVLSISLSLAGWLASVAFVTWLLNFASGVIFSPRRKVERSRACREDHTDRQAGRQRRREEKEEKCEDWLVLKRSVCVISALNREL